jgi:hypothetical protein
VKEPRNAKQTLANETTPQPLAQDQVDNKEDTSEAGSQPGDGPHLAAGAASFFLVVVLGLVS